MPEDRLKLTAHAALPSGASFPEYISTSQSTLIGRLFAKKSLDSHSASPLLGRHLGSVDLIFLGIGGTIGTGIFVLTGVAAQYAGPAVTLSYLIAGFVAALSALCYAELAALLPKVSGSCYSYTYVCMGEVVAWMVGWDLVLEYVVGAAAVACGWSGYFIAFLRDAFGVFQGESVWFGAPIKFDRFENKYTLSGQIINLPAVVIVLLVSTVLLVGIRESVLLNSAAVVTKLSVIALFLVTSVAYIDPSNWIPFVPQNTGTYGQFGVSGVFQATSLVFFSYIGFDAVSTTALECKRPQRDMPIGLMGSLVICTIIYILVSIAMTGLVPFTELNVAHPITVALNVTGIKWMIVVVELGAVAGLTSVLLVQLMGQPRIFLAMAVDGLLPAFFADVHPRFKTPYKTTMFTGIACSILAGLVPIEILGELTSIGTLFAFFLVCIGVTILRSQYPDEYRAFQVPGGPYLIPISGAVSCLVLIFAANPRSILRLFVWMAFGLVIYALYGYKHSKLCNARGKDDDDTLNMIAIDRLKSGGTDR